MLVTQDEAKEEAQAEEAERLTDMQAAFATCAAASRAASVQW